MNRFSLLTGVLALTLLASPMRGQNAAELLQKGIYTQETLGDLDGAIRLYRQALALSSGARSYAAQAQYRLAICLEKKGSTAEAQQLFEGVVRDFPEQKEIAAQARKHLSVGLDLLAAPWNNGEIQELGLRMAAGIPIGTAIYSIEQRSGSTDLISARMYIPNMLTLSRVEIDRDTMRPISTMYRNPILGEFRLDYSQPGLVRVETKGKEGSRSVKLSDAAFDNEEWVYLIRRLPLAIGQKISLRIMSPMGVELELTATPLAMEEVETPAGKFRCYKVEVDVLNQTFWIGADHPRPVVKFEANGLVAELRSIRQPDLMPVTYRNSDMGVSLSLPAGWLARPQPMEKTKEPEMMVSLLDPESVAHCALWTGQYRAAANERERKLTEEADRKVESRAKQFVGYKVRPDSRSPRQIGGRPAFSYIADFQLNKRPMVEYLTWVQTESAMAMVMVRVDAAEFEAFRKRFDPVIETLQVN